MSKSISKELSDMLADEIRKEIDFEIMTRMLCEQGWIQCKSADHYSRVDIKEWADKHCGGKIQGLGSNWLLSNEKDVILFILKWST
jgi:hypothetical protein